MFRPVPTCSCVPRCSCSALTTVRDYFRTEQIIRFLRGLNAGFSSVRSQILRSDPLPTINLVFSMVIQEEQELGLPTSGLLGDSNAPTMDSAQESPIVSATQADVVSPPVQSLCNFDLWHFRLGHSALPVPSSLKPRCSSDFHCQICPLAKLKRLPFPSSSSHSASVFELLHVVIWGPYSVPTIDNHRYFLTIVDDHSRFTWVCLLTSKSAARQSLINFCLEVLTQYDTSIKTIRTDNGLEFSIPQFYASKGITHQTTCVYTS
ncbi:Retrovirus-related Pol polyprotein from transposon RE2 [Linum grandiflorum]